MFTQKGLYTRRIMEQMGLNDLSREITSLRQSRSTPARRLGQELKKRREWLREQVRDYVEQQFLLHADATGRRLREDLLRKVKLSNVEQRNFRLIQEVVFRMAKKLAALHSRRKKVFKRGALNVPRTLRHNMAYDGAIFDLHWKSVKIDRPKVFAICDVSGSVANYARFMLMFLYSLEEVMPKVRSFAFSSDLAEVTELVRAQQDRGCHREGAARLQPAALPTTVRRSSISRRTVSTTSTTARRSSSSAMPATTTATRAPTSSKRCTTAAND